MASIHFNKMDKNYHKIKNFLFSNILQPDLNVDEIMRNLPKFEQPTMSTFSPYDINSVDSELVVKQRKSEETARFWRLCAAIGLGLAGAITLGVLR